jgi:hypothetical protein
MSDLLDSFDTGVILLVVILWILFEYLMYIIN